MPKSVTLSPISMDDQPYTSPDEDPFSAQPFVEEFPEKTIRHRRSSMLDKWILEQQAHSPECADSEPLELPKPYFSRTGSSSNPYLAYPDLPRVLSDAAVSTDDAASIISYDLVDDDDIPTTTIPSLAEAPVTPKHPRPHKNSRHSLTPSFRTINLSFRSNSPGPSSSPTNMEATSRAFSRLSFFPRTPRSTSISSTPQHNRTSSLSSTLTQSTNHPPVRLSTTTPKWRPSVLGHFHQPSASESSIAVSDVTPSRPSISSGDTYSITNTSHTATTVDSHIPTTPSKTSLFDSIRLRGNKSPRSFSTFSAAGSSSSVRLPNLQPCEAMQGPSSSKSESIKGTLPRRAPFAPKSGSVLDNIDDESDLDTPPTYRFPKHESTRPPIPTSSSGTLRRVKFSSLNSRSHRKRKRLVISGIGASELRKFEGVKRWCESFGEVKSISRMPNGDLQVDFRDPDVADTVCRVRAKVFIAGVGSVQLSWVAGSKR